MPTEVEKKMKLPRNIKTMAAAIRLIPDVAKDRVLQQEDMDMGHELVGDRWRVKVLMAVFVEDVVEVGRNFEYLCNRSIVSRIGHKATEYVEKWDY